MKTKKLPDTLHELLALAIKDLRKAERSKHYKINMAVWHLPNSHCSVCMAGAVMAFELKHDPKASAEPWHFNRKTSIKLLAINELRIGRVAAANWRLDQLAGQCSSVTPSLDREMTPYPVRANSTRQRERFYDDMKKLHKDLKKANL